MINRCIHCGLKTYDYRCVCGNTNFEEFEAVLELEDHIAEYLIHNKGRAEDQAKDICKIIKKYYEGGYDE